MPEILTDAYLLFTFVFKQALNSVYTVTPHPTLISPPADISFSLIRDYTYCHKHDLHTSLDHS